MDNKHVADGCTDIQDDALEQIQESIQEQQNEVYISSYSFSH